MSDEGSAQPTAAPAQQTTDFDDKADTIVDTKADSTPAAVTETKDEQKNAEEKVAEAAENEEPAKAAEETTEKPTEKPTEDEDIEMKDAPDTTAASAAGEAPKEEKTEQTEEAAAQAPNGGDATASTPTTSKSKTPARRKSTAGADGAKGKKLNKKGSKAAILHLDAKPGEHYFIKLKGYPQWPCIICDEDMLPHALIKTRPVSAARPDGSYREDYADGGKRAPDRTFPIMYLATNEFGWVSNKDLVDLDPEKVTDLINTKMRKDLQLAHQYAAENNDLDHYKGVLQQFQEELIEKQKAAEAKAAAVATPKKSKNKGKASADVEDVEMEQFDDEGPSTKPKKDKKRKNPEDIETPQRSESVKKPKIKLTNNNTPKSTNGATPKSAKAGGEAKSSKKAKKSAEATDVEKVQSPKEPEMSAEDRFERKKKEVLFLRHKLQKGLLTRNEQPKEEEMKTMSDYLTKLEGFPDLETDIIRATKINKVLKAMLKLEYIPKEEEFNFKARSQVLLDKWNKILAADDAPASAGGEEKEANGVNGHGTEAPAKEVKSDVNGVKKAGGKQPEAAKTEAKELKPEESKAEVKEPEKKADASEDKPAVDEATEDPEAIDVAA